MARSRLVRYVLDSDDPVVFTGRDAHRGEMLPIENIETRKSLHLDTEGRAFVYQEPDRYREVEPERILKLVLERRRH